MTDHTAKDALRNNLEEQGVEIQDMGDYGNLPDTGLMQTKSPYSTAVAVIKPRNVNLVIEKCKNEAALGGESFYYSWSQGGSIIEGLTVGAALMMIRNWGNCAVDVRVQELPNSYVFYGAFIDLETGFNLVRPFKMSKQSPKNKQGRDIYSGERGKDIIFQIGASKATRNVTLNAIPKYIADEVIAIAKKNVVKQVEKMGVPAATEKILKKADALKIPFDRVEANYGKKESWNINKIVAVMGALRSVEDGVESMEEVFSDKVAVNGEPEIKTKKSKEEPKSEAVPVKADDYIKDIKKLMKEEEVDGWEKENNDELTGLGKEDQEKIAEAILGHRSFLREVSRVNTPKEEKDKKK